MIRGIDCAIIELGGFFIISHSLRQYHELYLMNTFTYYWLMFTVLTGIWEFIYVTNKKKCTQKTFNVKK